ncbi:hypothetical protein RFI_36115 [Reticulomyxa filosa]|uniref:Uncharacterized protein n=1 Tax=Reticulomyxa filosa TaxID=46433 RepID=X6LKT3_RETFI|nr:hypothetical protein RFI_36115 [Reticulomyxa filosa]|eukprot:ETO01325.1 hypothetical protein RFI_36115 [Reticulomyxa filosa]
MNNLGYYYLLKRIEKTKKKKLINNMILKISINCLNNQSPKMTKDEIDKFIDKIKKLFVKNGNMLVISDGNLYQLTK